MLQVAVSIKRNDLKISAALLNLILASVFAACGGEAENRQAAVATVDLTEYRQETYGSPDHYCDPTRALSDAGSGTLQYPWNYAQCQSEPVAGEVIGHLPVENGTPVRLASRQGGSDEAMPAFMPANSGTSGHPIIHVTKYAAISMNRSTITGNRNRTEIRHGGTSEAADIAGTGGAAYGASNRNYIVFDGFFVDMAQAHMSEDSGVITARGSIGTEFRNFVIKGEITDIDSNPVIYRSSGSLNTVLSNFVVYDYDNQPTGEGRNQDGLFSVQYGDQNFLIEHFLLDNVDNGIFLKGSANSGTAHDYGTIQYGIIKNVQQCLRFNDFHASNLTTAQYILCLDYTSSAIGLSSETDPARNLLLHHVTAANGPNCLECSVLTISGDDSGMTNVTIRDNLFDYPSSGQNNAVFAWDWTHPFPTSNYNGYYGGGPAMSWRYNQSSYTTLADWRIATSQEANSLILTSDPFVNRSNHDFRVREGHPAKTASSNGGEIGAYATREVIGIYSITR